MYNQLKHHKAFKLLLIVASTFLMLASLVCSAAGKVGEQAPVFTLKDLAGKEHSLADFKGKYVFVDIWGTWCGYCVEVLPKIKKVYKNLDKDKIAFVSICVDCPDLDEFLETTELPWLQLVTDSGDKILNQFGVDAYPTPVLIDPNGKILESGIEEEGFERLDDGLGDTIKSYLK